MVLMTQGVDREGDQIRSSCCCWWSTGASHTTCFPAASAPDSFVASSLGLVYNEWALVCSCCFDISVLMKSTIFPTHSKISHLNSSLNCQGFFDSFTQVKCQLSRLILCLFISSFHARCTNSQMKWNLTSIFSARVTIMLRIIWYLVGSVCARSPACKYVLHKGHCCCCRILTAVKSRHTHAFIFQNFWICLTALFAHVALQRWKKASHRLDFLFFP